MGKEHVLQQGWKHNEAATCINGRKRRQQLGMVSNACDASTPEAEAGRSGVHRHCQRKMEGINHIPTTMLSSTSYSNITIRPNNFN